MIDVIVKIERDLSNTISNTGFLSQLRAKLRDWAVRPVRAGCHSWAALSLIDSKTLYTLGHPLSRDVFFSFLLEVPVTKWVAQLLQYQPNRQRNMSKMLYKTS